MKENARRRRAGADKSTEPSLDSLSQDHVGCCHKAPREILEEMLKTGLGGLTMRYLII
jgi:hypothetical protein